MRDKLGVLLMESQDGEVAVQLFADPEVAGKSFAELKGHAGEKPKRATFLDIRYAQDGQFRTCAAMSRNLPVPPEEPSDGWVLGEGPRKDVPS